MDSYRCSRSLFYCTRSSSLSKLGTYIAHNAAWPLTVQLLLKMFLSPVTLVHLYIFYIWRCKVRIGDWMCFIGCFCTAYNRSTVNMWWLGVFEAHLVPVNCVLRPCCCDEEICKRQLKKERRVWRVWRTVLLSNLLNLRGVQQMSNGAPHAVMDDRSTR